MFEGASPKLTARHVYVYVYAQVRWAQCSAVGAVQCCVVGAAILLCTRILLYPYTILPFCPMDFCVSSFFGLADQLSCGAFCFTKCRLQITFLFHGKF
jgi:hypothetical protein